MLLLTPERGAIAQFPARVETGVEQVARHDVGQRLEHGVLDAGVLDLEVGDQPLDALPLEAEVAAGRAAAADDRQLPLLRVQPRLGLVYIDKRANDDVLAVVGDQPRRHRLQRTGEEQVQKKRLDKVVGMVAEGNLGGADLAGNAVQHPSPQPGTQRTGRGVGLEDVVHQLADLRVLDAVLPAARLAGSGDDVVLEVLVAGVDVDGDEGKGDGRPLPQFIEDLEERPAVLAARQADHDAVAILDEIEVVDRPGRFLCDLCL